MIVKRNYPESDEQKAVIKWWRDLKKIGLIPAHYHLINTDTSAKRNLGQQARYKAMGGFSGVLDLILTVPLCDTSKAATRFYSGLWLEMKAPEHQPKTARSKGGLSNEQQQMIIDLKACGYKVEVCYTAQQAQKAIENYLGLKLT